MGDRNGPWPHGARPRSGEFVPAEDTQMSEENTNGRNLSVSVPMGALAAAATLVIAAAAYTLIGRNSEDVEEDGEGKSKSGGMSRRLGLMTLVTLIENDASRKILVAMLRAIARRS